MVIVIDNKTMDYAPDCLEEFFESYPSIGRGTIWCHDILLLTWGSIGHFDCKMCPNRDILLLKRDVSVVKCADRDRVGSENNWSSLQNQYIHTLIVPLTIGEANEALTNTSHTNMWRDQVLFIKQRQQATSDYRENPKVRWIGKSFLPFLTRLKIFSI